VKKKKKSSFSLFDILYILTDNKLIVHLGGKIMQHIKALRTISLILGFALVTFGCATGKNQVANADFGLTAEAVPEGILVKFSNVPLKIKDIGVCFRDWGSNEEPDWESIDELATFNYVYDLRESTCHSAIEQVRQTGTVIFPFAQSGHKYFITAFLIGEDNNIGSIIRTECVADGGIYLNTSIDLNLNNAHTGVALSNAPVFPSDVQLRRTINYCIYTQTGEYAEAIISGPIDELFWNFEPRFSEHLKETGVTSGDYPTFVGANISVTHDKTSWVMDIAKSPVFTYSL
jgi:hypothetical protein